MGNKEIYNFIKKITPEIIAIRRQLHSFPELSLKEFKTTQFICNFLDKLGIKHKRLIDTGVVAEIMVNKSLPTIALRAEIDALPIQEENSFEYVSKNNGEINYPLHNPKFNFNEDIIPLAMKTMSEIIFEI